MNKSRKSHLLLKSTDFTFGSLLKFFRNRADKPQKVIADKVGCHAQTVWSWEANKYPPEPERLEIICRELSLNERDAEDLKDAYLRDRTMETTRKCKSKSLAPLKSPDIAPFAQKIPLLRKTDTLNPTVISHTNKWRGRYIWKPQELEGRIVAAFLVEDDAMSPRFNLGDYLFFDLKKTKPQKNKPYVFSAQSRLYCRLMDRWHPLYFFKVEKSDQNLMSIARAEIKWCYQVVWRTTRIE